MNPDPAAAEAEPNPIEVVAIDGPSGSGKSTVARQLAQALGFAYLDTGAMYRAVTWHFLERQCAPAELGDDPADNDRRMREALDGMRLRLLPSGHIEVNGHDVTNHLRSREVESQVSAVSALPFVRRAMRNLQRQVALAGPVVAEGRDMTSVVFPKARWQVFLDADVHERARRRQLDFEARGRHVSQQEVLEEIEVRDRLDSTRKDAPLQRTAGAHYVDSTGRSSDEVVASILAWIRGGA